MTEWVDTARLLRTALRGQEAVQYEQRRLFARGPVFRHLLAVIFVKLEAFDALGHGAVEQLAELLMLADALVVGGRLG